MYISKGESILTGKIGQCFNCWTKLDPMHGPFLTLRSWTIFLQPYDTKYLVLKNSLMSWPPRARALNGSCATDFHLPLRVCLFLQELLEH